GGALFSDVAEAVYGDSQLLGGDGCDLPDLHPDEGLPDLLTNPPKTDAIVRFRRAVRIIGALRRLQHFDVGGGTGMERGGSDEDLQFGSLSIGGSRSGVATPRKSADTDEEGERFVDAVDAVDQK
ncbi:hypothetical protein HK101_008525, partial [Irineochytrium annulatum]